MNEETQERQTFYYSYSFDGREGRGQIDLGIPPPFATTDVEVVLQRFALERALREVANTEGIVVTNFEDELCYGAKWASPFRTRLHTVKQSE